MNKLLLFAIISASVASASAQRPLKPLKAQQRIHNRIAPVMRASELPAGMEMFESFEDWDGEDKVWVPTGWTVDVKGEADRADSWTPQAKVYGLPSPSDGNVCFAINDSELRKDDWLISPEFEVKEGYELSYYLFFRPWFLFAIAGDQVDWTNNKFNTQPEVAANIEIWAQPEGGEWQQLFDLADIYKDYDPERLMVESDAFELTRRTIDLAGFIGKKVRVAFRYVGTDGDTMLIDQIGVGYQPIEGVTYLNPFSMLYWGFDNQSTALLGDVAMIPVNSPLTWQDNSYIEGASQSWTYCDPETAQMVNGFDNSETLTLTYRPDYSSADRMKNNFYFPPKLKLSAPLHAPGEFTDAALLMQAGGKAERTLEDGTEFYPSLLPFAYNSLGMATTTVEDEKQGIDVIPVFGYDANVDNYWLDYSLNGNTKADTDYAHLTGIANLFMPTESPLVVTAASVMGFGKMADDAELVLSVYAFDETMSADLMTLVASDTIHGYDVIADTPDYKGELLLPFEFDEPVVLKATEEHPAYYIEFSGFRSDKVEFFSPYHSAANDRIGWGFIKVEIDMSAHIENGKPYTSYKSMCYKRGDEYIDNMLSAFAIGLFGEYPWLETEVKGVELSADEFSAEVALGSYYSGEQLKIEAPAGLTATATGRYNECKLTIARDATGAAVTNGSIKVSAPGVELTIPVKAEQAGIAEISVDETVSTETYDLTGRRVVAPSHGIYINRRANGQATKNLIR